MLGKRAPCSVALVLLAALGLAAFVLQGACFACGRTASPRLRGRALTRAQATVGVDAETDRGASAAGGSIVGGVLGFLAGGSAAAVLGVAIGIVAGYASEQSQLDRVRAVNKAGFNPTEELGAIPPLGYWDPAGVMKKNLDGDSYNWEWKDRETFEYYRGAELKHGRLAMVALTGMLTAAFVRFPGSQYEMGMVPDGLAVSQSGAACGIGIIFLLAAFVELENGDGKFEDPANLQGSGFLYLGKDFDGYSDDLRNKELAHGRLAMSTVFTLWVYEYGADISPETLFQNPKPVSLVGFLLLLVFWSQYYVDIYDESNPTPVLAGSEAKAALPAGSEAKAALPAGTGANAALSEPAKSLGGGPLIAKTTVSGKIVYRFSS